MAIHAIAQAGRLRTVIENMAQMGVAIGATHFGAGHEKRAVGVFANRIALYRLREAGPTCSRLKFSLGIKQGLAAANTGENPLALLIEMRPRSGPLCAVLARDIKLLWRKLCAPFGVTL